MLCCVAFLHYRGMRKIKLTQGKYALVDDADFESLNKFKWSVFAHAHGNSYARRARDRSPHYMHRQILRARKGQIVDHINGNGLDNRRKNPRFATAAQNQWNRVRVEPKGVRFHNGAQRKKRWYAGLQKNGKYISGGIYLTRREAVVAYRALKRRHHGV